MCHPSYESMSRSKGVSMKPSKSGSVCIMRLDRNILYADGACKLANPLVSLQVDSYTVLEKRGLVRTAPAFRNRCRRMLYAHCEPEPTPARRDREPGGAV